MSAESRNEFYSSLNGILASIADSKTYSLMTASLAAAVFATYFIGRGRKSKKDTEYPDLPNAHWLKGHMGYYNKTKSYGKLLQSLNASVNYPAAFFFGYFGNKRLTVFTLEEFREFFYTQGQKTIGRNFPMRIHMEKESIDGIVGVSGPIWKSNRRIFHNHLRTFGREKQLQLVLQESKYLTEALESSLEEFDAVDLLQHAVCNVICSLSFGTRYDYDDKDHDKIFESILSFNVKHYMLPHFIMELLKKFPVIPAIRRRFEAQAITKRFIRAKIDERIQTGIREPAETLIDAYAADKFSNDDEGKAVENLIAVIYEIFFAGTETTSSSLGWFLACVAAHPEVQEKMYAEIESVLGHSELCLAHFRELNYFIAAQYEIQRFGSIASNTLPHTTVEEMTLPSGKRVANDVIVQGALYSIMRDPKNFKYPEDFNPENFLDDDSKFQNTEAFVPYGIGPRICLGQTLADLELKVFMIEILRKFKISSSEKIDLNDSVQRLTCAPAPHKYKFELR